MAYKLLKNNSCEASTDKIQDQEVVQICYLHEASYVLNVQGSEGHKDAIAIIYDVVFDFTSSRAFQEPQVKRHLETVFIGNRNSTLTQLKIHCALQRNY